MLETFHTVNLIRLILAEINRIKLSSLNEITVLSRKVSQGSNGCYLAFLYRIYLA